MIQPVSYIIANFLGVAALLLWSSTALLLSYCSGMPPFLLMALTSFVGFFVFLAVWVFKGESVWAHFRFPWPVLLFAIAGAGGYRLLYFLAMHDVPAVEASLINYLWPVLIILFLHFLPEEKLRWFHLVGTFLGFVGVYFLLSPGWQFLDDFSFGHLLALFAAVVWAGYSVISRRIKKFSSMVVPVASLFSGVIFSIFSFFLGEWQGDFYLPYLPLVFILGVVGGLGVFLWDVGMKHGNIKILGIFSFFVPLISTGFLVAFGRAELEGHIVLATVLIFSSAVFAAADEIYKGVLGVLKSS